MTPRLSILVPVYRDDVSPLLTSLAAQDIDPATVELCVMDDGSDRPNAVSALRNALADLPLPTRFTAHPENRGRAATRNALFEQARADWVLFLDADMRLDDPAFLQRYVIAIEAERAEIIFGGFKVEARADRDRDLHRALSEVSDCISAAERQAAGAQFVASSNLCIRKDVLTAVPFDAGFSGWGWEDSEWAARAAKQFTILHLDNPATHLGLETTDTLLQRFAGSGANYRRFTEAHPDLAQSLSLFRVTERLKSIPGHTLLRALTKAIIRSHIPPMKARVFALKLWRASHYAEAMR